jgi:hypothetical protein
MAQTPTVAQPAQPSGNTLGNVMRPAFGYVTGPILPTDTPMMVLDTGASHHMLNDSSLFLGLRPIAIDIATGNKRDSNKLRAVAQGTAVIRVKGGQLLHLHDALFVPNITQNLVSLVHLGSNLH